MTRRSDPPVVLVKWYGAAPSASHRLGPLFRCQAVDSGVSNASTVWRQVASAT